MCATYNNYITSSGCWFFAPCLRPSHGSQMANVEHKQFFQHIYPKWNEPKVAQRQSAPRTENTTCNSVQRCIAFCSLLFMRCLVKIHTWAVLSCESLLCFRIIAMRMKNINYKFSIKSKLVRFEIYSPTNKTIIHLCCFYFPVLFRQISFIVHDEPISSKKWLSFWRLAVWKQNRIAVAIAN